MEASAPTGMARVVRLLMLGWVHQRGVTCPARSILARPTYPRLLRRELSTIDESKAMPTARYRDPELIYREALGCALLQAIFAGLVAADFEGEVGRRDDRALGLDVDAYRRDRLSFLLLDAFDAGEIANDRVRS